MALLHPNTPARITLFDQGVPATRWTLQVPDREGRTLRITPDATVHTATGQGRERRLLCRGCRLELVLRWHVGGTSAVERYDTATSKWGPAQPAATAAALLEIQQACETWPVKVEPWMIVEPWQGAGVAFLGRTYDEDLKLRDLKGVAHLDLELRLASIDPQAEAWPIPTPREYDPWLRPLFVESGFVQWTFVD